MSAFTLIKADDLLSFLKEQGFIEMNLPYKEIVYGKKIAKDLTLRIFTSIPHDSNVVYKRGKDAIRLIVMKRYFTTSQLKVIPIMKKARKVYRVEGWKENLQKAIEELINIYG